MDMKHNVLIEKLRKEINPTLKASTIRKYINDSLVNNSISLYEAYMLSLEALRLEREGYIKPAWNKKVYIKQCIAILNMKMLAYLFSESKSMDLLDNWAQEAYKLNREKRKHYVLDKYEKYLDFDKNIEVLKELLKRRKNKSKPFDDGPYHTEIFPFEYCEPEELIINHDLLSEKHIDESIENLLVEINLLDD